MCGRFSLSTSGEDLARHFDLAEAPVLVPRYNIAPSQDVAAVRLDPELFRRRLSFLRWGLIPPWAKNPGQGAKMINTRSETAAQRPAFGQAFRRRRCLIPASGFFEWRGRTDPRQPFFFRLRGGGPLALAGLWEQWVGAEGQAVESCTVLTVAANELVQPVHDRMPVIVAPKDYTFWLDPEVNQPEALAPVLRPYPPEEMTADPVSPRVNSPGADDPGLVEPLPQEKQGELFPP